MAFISIMAAIVFVWRLLDACGHLLNPCFTQEMKLEKDKSAGPK